MVSQPHSNDYYFDISEYLGKCEDSVDMVSRKGKSA
jgi:hypothetical protein